MKLIDERGKLFGKFNAVDFTILLIIVVLIFGAFYKFRVLDKTSTKAAMVPVKYTIEVRKIRDYVYQNVKEGDPIFDKTSGNCIGKIVEVKGTPAKDTLMLTDGSYQTVEIQNRLDVIFTIEAEATVSDSGYFVNRNYELVSNSARRFMTKYFECEGKIKDVFESETVQWNKYIPIYKNTKQFCGYYVLYI